DYSPGELTVATGFTVWHLLSLLVWIAVGVLAWRTRRTIPGIAIGLVWMVITISPVANIVFPTEFLIAERTLYLPSFGIVFGLAWAAAAIRSPRDNAEGRQIECALRYEEFGREYDVADIVFPTEFLIAERTLYLPSFGIVFGLAWAAAAIRSPRLRLAVIAVAVAAGAARTIIRIPAWHDDETHYQALKREAPRSYRTLWLEGKDEFAAGRWGSGEQLLRQAIAFAPSLAGPRYDLAMFYMHAKLWQPAIEQLQVAVAVDSAFEPARAALQQALQAAGDSVR